MLVKPEIASEFLKKYKLLMRLLNGGIEPNGPQEYAPLRDLIYEKLNDIESSFTESIGIEFIQSLKHAEFGKFAYLKKYRDGYAFYSLNRSKYYLVLALNTPFEDFLDEYCIIKTAVVPFMKINVCDGLVIDQNVFIGKNMAKELRDGYWMAKKNGELVI